MCDANDFCDYDYPGECPACEDGRKAFEEDVRDGIYIGEKMVAVERRMRRAGITDPEERVRAVRGDL